MSTVHLYTDYNWGQVSTVHWLQLITPVHWGTTTVKTTGSGRIWVMWFNDNHFLLRKLQSVCPLSVSWCHVVANIVKVELLICTFKAYNWPQRTKYFLSRWKVDGLKPGGRDTTAGVTRPSAGCGPLQPEEDDRNLTREEWILQPPSRAPHQTPSCCWVTSLIFTLSSHTICSGTSNHSHKSQCLAKMWSSIPWSTSFKMK